MWRWQQLLRDKTSEQECQLLAAGLKAKSSQFQLTLVMGASHRTASNAQLKDSWLVAIVF